MMPAFGVMDSSSMAIVGLQFSEHMAAINVAI